MYLESLDRAVRSAIVDGDAHSDGLSLPDPRLLQLLQSEPPSETQLRVVAAGRTADDGTEQSHGATGRCGNLRLTSIAATQLLPGLVEPELHTLLPVLVE